MAVDLEDLVPALRRSITQPGSELYSDVPDSVLVGYLSDAVWVGKLDGFYVGFDEVDGIVTPESGTTDLARDWQQLVVFYAGMQIVENELRSKNTLFRTKAGPVEYEVQNSAQLLREHLRAMNERRDYLLDLLSSKYNISPGYIDSVCARTNALQDGLVTFSSGSGF